MADPLPESTNACPTSPTTDIQPELLPCPFCGSDELSHGWSEPGYTADCQGIVQCHSCDAYMLGGHEIDAIAAWNTRLTSTTPTLGDMVQPRLALEAIKAVTATTKDAVAGLSRIMAITCSAGVDAPYSDLMAKPDVALIVNRKRALWRHLFERPKACAIPPEGWTCSRAPGHDGPCAASPIPTSVANEDKGNHDCLAKRRPDEPMFILLGRDPDAWQIVRAWANRRLAAGGDPEHCMMGLRTANVMRDYAADPANRPASAPPADAYPRLSTSVNGAGEREEWTVDEIRASVRASIDAPGCSHNQFCREKGLAPAKLSEFLSGKRGAEPGIIGPIGFRVAIVPHDDEDIESLALSPALDNPAVEGQS